MYNSRNKDKVFQYRNRKKKPNKTNKLNVNKKKIRNWQTIIKNLDTLKERHLFKNSDEMKNELKNHYHYMKLTIDPFYRLIRRNPPLWFKKQLVAALLEVFENWKKYISQLETPYYLKIWIYETNFMESQIVLAIENRIEWYTGIFEIHVNQKPFLHDLYSSEQYDTHKMDWVYAKVYQCVSEEDFPYYDAKELKRLFANNLLAPIGDHTGDKEKQYSYHCDNVWIGSR